jgi:2-keto-3-deoxy-L-rhamnonate aldolase RhmA
MNGNEMRQKLHRGERVYGTLLVSPSPRWGTIIKTLGLDYLFIDSEHIPQDREKLSWMCLAYAGMGLVPVMRIPSPDPFQAVMAVDGGAQGVIAPYIEDPEQVKRLVGSIRYRPLKGKKLMRILDGLESPDADLMEYLDNYNFNQFLIINIESVPALEALDEILVVDGLDAVLVGPHDLTTSLGIPEQYNHPKFLNAVEMIINKSRQKGLGVGVHFDDLQQQIEWMKMGANLISHSGDIRAFGYNIRKEIHTMREALGDHEVPTSDEAIII